MITVIMAHFLSFILSVLGCNLPLGQFSEAVSLEQLVQISLFGVLVLSLGFQKDLMI